MNRLIFHFSLCLLSALSLSAQALEKWTLTDGRSFDAQVKSVTPGLVIFARPSGPDAPMEISKLSEASQKRLIEVLGFTVSPPAASTNAPGSVTPPRTDAPTTPAAVQMNAPTRNSSAIDATDISMIDSRYGLKGTIIGKTSTVSTLGSTGHKKISFSNSDFYLFINKRVIDANPEWKPDIYAGKIIQVEGEIAKYQDQLQIQITDPSQISLVTP